MKKKQIQTNKSFTGRMVVPLLIIAGLIFSYAPAFADVTTNLVSNPDLETATVPNTPDGWTQSWYGTSTTTFAYIAGPTGNAVSVNLSNYQDGDAKWVFTPVAVTSGRSYLFTDSYSSDVPTKVIAVYEDANHVALPAADPGSVGWAGVVPATLSNVWATTTNTFTPPTGASYMTVLHAISSNGTLLTDNYSVTELPLPPTFGNGVVTITFDDGWESQYQNAFPILRTADLKASFYLVSSTLIPGAVVDPNILCDDPLVSYCNRAVIEITPSSFRASGQYPDPLVDTYIYSENYESSSTSTVMLSYVDDLGFPIAGQPDILLETLPVGTSSFSKMFTIPPAVFSLISTSTNSSPSFTITHTVPAGETLQVINPKLIRKRGPVDFYMVPSQVLEMQADGQEIGAHTVDHCNLALLDADPNSAMTGACASLLPTAISADYQIGNSLAAIQAIGATPVDTFVYPYGGFNANVEAIVASHGFISARTVNVGYNTHDSDLFALNNQIINKALTDNPQGLDIVKSWIDTATTTQKWLILTFHGVQTEAQIAQNEIITPGSAAEATTDVFFQEIVNYLKTKGVCVSTMHDATVALKNSVDPCAPVPADTTPPVISNMPTDITLYTDVNDSVAVTYTNPTATDNSGTVVIGCSPVSGSTFAIGTSTVTCTATDPSSNSASSNFSIGVVYIPAPVVPGIEINPDTLSAGVVGTAYSQTLSASTTAVGPFTWSIASGVLPGGLTLNDSTAIISGTPTANGAFNFSTFVTDGGMASTTKTYTINIAAAPTPPPPPPSSGGGGGGGGGGYTPVTPYTLKGDCNKDGKVNMLDFVTLMANWGKTDNNNIADFNSDKKVDVLDFVLLMANWSK